MRVVSDRLCMFLVRQLDSITTSCRQRFGVLADPPTKLVSCIIPAYNEEERISVMLDEILEYLEKCHLEDRFVPVATAPAVITAIECSNFTYELLVVDDGSKDATVEVVKQYTQRYGSDIVRLLSLHTNNGKGGAVKKARTKIGHISQKNNKWIAGNASCSGKLFAYGGC